MPTYEYACDACENHWEANQRMSEGPLKVCPKCGQETAKRLISGGNFMLKGDGWYKDLYHKPKKSGGESGSGSSGSGSSGSGSSGSGGGESKSA